MNRITRLSSLLLVLVFFILAACGGAKPTPDSGADQAYTQIWQTVEAGQALTAAAVTPTLQFTSTPEITNTPEPTNTPLVTTTSEPPQASITPRATNTIPRPTTQAVCDNSSLAEDVTIPDGTEVPGGTTFIKTWRFKNLGPCTWNENYLLIFAYSTTGANWTKASAVHFPKTVKPNETVDISVEMDAPAEKGSYAAWFRLQNDKGFNFGDFFWVSINVPK